MDIIKQTQDLTYLKWSHIRSSSGTAGTFLKSELEQKKREAEAKAYMAEQEAKAVKAAADAKKYAALQVPVPKS